MIAPIFLSASEPSPERDKQYWPGNLLHIREAVRALCAHILPHYPLVYGGHPAITPMVNQIAARTNLGREQKPPPKILMFRSDLYVSRPDPGIPDPLTEVFLTPAEDMAVTPAHQQSGELEAGRNGWRNASLLRMRYEMLGRPGPYPVHPSLERIAGLLGRARERVMKTFEFSAAVFIGGMEGVEKEFNIFRSFHPTTPVYPIASTGSACEGLFQRVEKNLQRELPALKTALRDREVAYSLLMQDLFPVPPAGSEGARERQPWSADPDARNTASHIDPEKLDKPRPTPASQPMAR
jgi:hypothetical protein